LPNAGHSLGVIWSFLAQFITFSRSASSIGRSNNHTETQKSEELGRTAVQVLAKLLNKEKVKKLTLLEPELKVRQSARRLET
jgi:hypothetical protein